MSIVELSEGAKALFIEYVEDADNWFGNPYTDANVQLTEERKGFLTKLKKEGLLFTVKDEFGSYVVFEEKGKEYAKELGFDLSWIN